ncbi:hypothetical protein FRC04_003297 [Tulasnella sp. 424]|nr:hypothetical protein FRC04_003297 [Tulasnella sp. 424]KAG8965812.1 hypothetical protein FRC05_002993 [Tulasnella sp. 425]
MWGTTQNRPWAPEGPDPASRTSSIPSSTDPVFNNELQRKYFNLTAQAAADAGPYDIIIVGTGMGGGVLAGDLFDTNSKIGDGAKKILVIEKGDLVFHSYCLNSARPGGAQKDRGHQNGLFFTTFKGDYDVRGAKETWNGGPMHCLGGRSTTWGLYAPRMHDRALQTCFSDAVRTALTSEFYEMAERLMNLALPWTKTIHQHVMERLNMDDAGRGANVQWQWGRTASEVRYAGSSKGAFSTIDKLLQIATSKPMAKQESFKILLGVEAREIVWTQTGGVRTADKVKVKTASGNEIDIQLAAGGKVVLCAGSVASPAILLRSNADLPSREKVTLKDHEIFYKIRPFRYQDPSVRSEVGPMKLQTYVWLGAEIALVNLCLDSSGFLPRAKGIDDDIPKLTTTFTTRKSSGWKGEVRLNSDREPVIDISRDEEPLNRAEQQTMETVTKAAMKTIQDVLKVEFLDQDDKEDTQDEFADPYPKVAQQGTTPKYFQRLRMGVLGHEMGTLPMALEGGDGPVDENLSLKGHGGVYICDMSVFRELPDANPSLTLAALSIRLSRLLLPRDSLEKPKDNELKVVNHSGETIQVWVSDQGNVANGGQNDYVQLRPGAQRSWTRDKDIPEAVFVFRRDPRKSGENDFLKEPELVLGFPGRLLPVM